MARVMPRDQLQLELSRAQPPAHARGDGRSRNNDPLAGAPEASQGGRAVQRVASHKTGPNGRSADAGSGAGARRPSAAELLETPGALLTRSQLRGLGLERRAIDAVFRTLPVVALPGYSRPMIRADQYLELVDRHTYRDDRVRPCS